MRLVFAMILLLVGWGEAAAQDPSHVSVALRERGVTLSARDASLREILTEISRVSGIQIYLEASVTAQESTTISFDGVPPDEGLRRLLRAKNFIFVYAAGALAEVRVYTEGRGEFQRLAADAKPPFSRAVLGRKAPPSPRPRETDPAQLKAGRPRNSDPGERSPGPPASAAAEQDPTRLQAEALGNPDPDERAAVLDELAGSDNQELALSTAMKVLETERVSEVLQSALSIFAGMESAPLDPILAFVTGGRVHDPDVRIQALELLTERGEGDPRVRALLGRLARNDKDSNVRETARTLLQDLTE